MIRFQSGRVAGSSGCSDLADTSRGPPSVSEQTISVFRESFDREVSSSINQRLWGPSPPSDPTLRGALFSSQAATEPSGRAEFHAQ